jgi:glucose/arabinose dehydrogenase
VQVQAAYVDQPYSNHNGGQLQFGPDGLLYVGMGDGGSQKDPQNRSQDLAQRLGKLLRIDVDAPRADWELVAYGLRNPWRFSFDRLTGDLYIGDVGQYDWEEIDFTPADSPGLENYGWNAFEEPRVRAENSTRPGTSSPIYEYDHDRDAPSPAAVYRGKIARRRAATSSGTTAPALI